MIDSNLINRIQRHASQWHVVVEETFETASSVIAFGTRAEQPVVLKVVRQPGDEWRSGEILKAFAGNGTVHVYEHTPGAALLERLRPGNSVVELTLNGHDDEATDILANVIQQISARATSMSPSELPPACATVEDWAKRFSDISKLATKSFREIWLKRVSECIWNYPKRNAGPDCFTVICSTTTCYLIRSAAGWQRLDRINRIYKKLCKNGFYPVEPVSDAGETARGSIGKLPERYKHRLWPPAKLRSFSTSET